MPGRQGVSAVTVTHGQALAMRVAVLCRQESAAPTRRRAPDRVSGSGQRPAAAVLRARRRLSAQEGFSLIETVISLSLLALGALVLFAQLDAQTNMAARQLQRDAQAETAAAVRSHAEGALAQAVSVGLTDGVGGIDPLTLAGDQLVYETPNAPAQSRCRRLFYVAATRELREAVGPACSVLQPTRGPNETDNTAADPVLDGARPSALIASHLVLSADGQGGPLLTYLGANDAPLSVDTQARTSGTHAGIYADQGNRARVQAVQLDLIADARVTGAAQGSVTRASIRRTLRGGA